MMPKTHSGRCTIIFENRKELLYTYGSYKKLDSRIKFYNIALTKKQCHEVANKMPDTYHVNKILPNFKIMDENRKTLFDSKFDHIEEFLD